MVGRLVSFELWWLVLGLEVLFKFWRLFRWLFGV